MERGEFRKTNREGRGDKKVFYLLFLSREPYSRGLGSS